TGPPPRLNLDDMQGGSCKEVLHAREREESEVCTVQEPLALVAPVTPQQVKQNRGVLDVGDTRQNLRPLAHPGHQPRQHSPGVNHMFKHIAEDQTVDAWLCVGQAEVNRLNSVGFTDGHAVETAACASQKRGFLVFLDAVVADIRVDLTVGLSQG